MKFTPFTFPTHLKSKLSVVVLVAALLSLSVGLSLSPIERAGEASLIAQTSTTDPLVTACELPNGKLQISGKMPFPTTGASLSEMSYLGQRYSGKIFRQFVTNSSPSSIGYGTGAIPDTLAFERSYAQRNEAFEYSFIWDVDAQIRLIKSGSTKFAIGGAITRPIKEIGWYTFADIRKSGSFSGMIASFPVTVQPCAEVIVEPVGEVFQVAPPAPPAPSVGGREILSYDNGEVLTWKMFYKLLTEKEMNLWEDWWEEHYDMMTRKKVLPGYDSNAVWFRAAYPEYPYYNPSDPADPNIVRLLYDGLPPGVTSSVDGPTPLLSIEPLDFSSSNLSSIFDGVAGEFLDYAASFNIFGASGGLEQELVDETQVADSFFGPGTEEDSQVVFTQLDSYEGFVVELEKKIFTAEESEVRGIIDSALIAIQRFFPVTEGELYMASAPSEGVEEILHHPNGEVLNWAMFYKFLAEKEMNAWEEWWEEYNDSLRFKKQVAGEWYVKYATWFRAAYPGYPYYDLVDPADPDIVRLLYGGLPPGVTSEILYPDVSYLAPPVGGTEVLYHSNGEVLNWAMFYKFLAEKEMNAWEEWWEEYNDSLRFKKQVAGEWYVKYATWFRAAYPGYPYYDPVDPVDPDIVRLLYGGLPPGVTSEILNLEDFSQRSVHELDLVYDYSDMDSLLSSFSLHGVDGFFGLRADEERVELLVDDGALASVNDEVALAVERFQEWIQSDYVDYLEVLEMTSPAITMDRLIQENLEFQYIIDAILSGENSFDAPIESVQEGIEFEEPSFPHRFQMFIDFIKSTSTIDTPYPLDGL